MGWNNYQIMVNYYGSTWKQIYVLCYNPASPKLLRSDNFKVNGKIHERVEPESEGRRGDVCTSLETPNVATQTMHIWQTGIEKNHK